MADDALIVPPQETVAPQASPAGSPEEEREPEHGIDPADLVRIAFVAVAIAVAWTGVWHRVLPFDVLSLVAVLVGGYPILREAVTAIAAHRMTMELSMTIALLAAVAISEFFTAAMIVLFVLIAEVLEHMTVSRGRNAIRDLLEFLPNTVTVKRDGRYEDIPRSELRSGDTVLTRPGGKLAADGTVVGGTSYVDESAITGEPMPHLKDAGKAVFAGTVNRTGMLEYRVSRVGRETAFGKIVEAVERAEKSRAPIQKTADVLAGYLVYFAMGCAALTFLVTRDIRSTISVVIVAGACGVAAGTPLAILGAIGRAARSGAIVKGGLYMELLGKIDTVVFDKTGTLTFGSPEVASIDAVPGLTHRDLIALAATAECASEHPIANAITRKATEMGIDYGSPERFDSIPGKGITCAIEGQEVAVGSPSFLVELGIGMDGHGRAESDSTAVLVARGGRLVGSLAITDRLRPEAVEALQGLRESGVRTLLLSGDREAAAQAVAERLGVSEVHANLLPDGKLALVGSLIAQGRRVAMIGDGINDAPALARATVGIAMGSGTDIARESADVLLLGNDLLKFVATLRIARRCRRIILTNFSGTLVVDAVGMALAAMGLLHPMFAALLHVSSEMAFILNSARLLPITPRTD